MTKEEEQELADKLKPLFDEIKGLEQNRGCGVTLDKNEYIGDRQRELQEKITQLKTKS